MLSYVIARLLYPNQRWRIMRSHNKYALIGRDLIIGANIATTPDLETVCGMDDEMMMEIIEEGKSTLAHLASKYPGWERGEVLFSPLYTNPLREGPLDDVMSAFPYLTKEIYRIVENYDVDALIDLPIPPLVIPSVIVSIEMYETIEIFKIIFDKIPPAGCGTLFHQHLEIMSDVSI